MKPAIVDASVVVKWFAPFRQEPLSDRARLLLESWVGGKMELVAPDLVEIEVASVLWKAVRRGQCTVPQAHEVLAALVDYPLSRRSTLLTDSALRLALQYGRSVYDSMYLAMAVLLQGELITADEKLANAVAGSLPVKWLGAF